MFLFLLHAGNVQAHTPSTGIRVHASFFMAAAIAFLRKKACMTTPFQSAPRGMRIQTRLTLGFGLLIAMMLVMVVVGFVGLTNVSNSNKHLIEKDWGKAEAANTLSSIALANGRRTVEILTAPSAAHRAQMRAEISGGRDAFVKAFKTLQDMVELPEARALLKQAEEARGRYVISQAKFNKLVDESRVEEAAAELNGHTLRELNAVQVSVDALAEIEHRIVVENGVKAAADAHMARLILLAMGAGGLLCGVVLAISITRSIVVPLMSAVQVAQAVAAGDLSSRIEVRTSDETGLLMQALKDMNHSLSGIVGEVRNSSDAIATATSQIAAGNLDLSSRTEEQASALEQTSASMQELAGTVKQNFDSGKHANELAESASKVAVKGGAVVAEVVHTMEAINTSSRKIADIIGVIDSIAFQTNILALNAAVEAARAGEQGRGFAVVASEVRSLAGRSAAAAKEIKTLIDSSVQQVATGTDIVRKAGATIQDIVASSQRVNQLLGDVATGAREQNLGITQITEAVQELDRMTQQNAALVEETAAAAASMQDQAHHLAEEVARFKLPANAQLESKNALAHNVAPVEGFNFDQAIEAHRQWKVRLRSAIAKKGKLDADTICRDDQCPLGKWLHGAGSQRWSQKPLFTQLLGKHADFHQSAGSVARKINAGQYADAENLIGAGSHFSSVSLEVTTLLSTAKRQF